MSWLPWLAAGGAISLALLWHAQLKHERQWKEANMLPKPKPTPTPPAPPEPPEPPPEPSEP